MFQQFMEFKVKEIGLKAKELKVLLKAVDDDSEVFILFSKDDPAAKLESVKSSYVMFGHTDDQGKEEQGYLVLSNRVYL